MPVVEATALCGARSSIQFIAHDPAADLAALGPLAERCGRFSPWVGWDTLGGRGAADWQESKFAGLTLLESPSALLLDIQGIVSHFGDEAAFASEVQREFCSAGYEVVLGLAETIGAAWALAFADEQNFPETSTNNVRLSPPLNWQQLPIELLRLLPETTELLHRLGVMYIDQLLRLPRQELPARFGSLLLRRIDQALGNVAEWVVPYRPVPKWEVERRLDYPLTRRDILEEILQQLLSQLGALLRQQDLGAMQLECRLAGEGKSLRLEVGLCRPSASPQRMWELLRLPWERTPLVGPIDRLELRVLRTGRLSSEQRELFIDLHDTSEPHDLIERLTGRLGKEAVGRPLLRAEVLPERSFQVRSLTGGNVARTVSKDRKKPKPAATLFASEDPQPPAGWLPWQRPLTLLPPRAIQVRCEPGGAPLLLGWSAGEEEVVRSWGPERLETGWWRGRTVRRDYYRVETAAGRRYWLFRNLVTGEWYWQGSF